MNYLTTTIYIDIDELNRRRLDFICLRDGVELDYDADESRKSTRHKWVEGISWSRLSHRGKRLSHPREVPFDVRHRALDEIRMQIKYKDNGVKSYD